MARDYQEAEQGATKERGPSRQRHGRSHVAGLCIRGPILALLAFAGACEIPTPQAPATPIGSFPRWGEGFGAATPKTNEQMPSLLASPSGAEGEPAGEPAVPPK